MENAIRHNAHTPEKKLKINLLTDGDWLIVSNNRLPLLSDGGSTRMGLTYMDETMLLLFNRNIQVESDDRHFTVRLPLVPPGEAALTHSLRP